MRAQDRVLALHVYARVSSAVAVCVVLGRAEENQVEAATCASQASMKAHALHRSCCPP